MVVTVIRLEASTGMFTFSLRLGFLATAFAVYLYVYTAARDGAPGRRLFGPLCWFWRTVLPLPVG
ncbi:hypothetical protein ACWEOZ_37435 [Actinoplanes sp. NPDC004185]